MYMIYLCLLYFIFWLLLVIDVYKICDMCIYIKNKCKKKEIELNDYHLLIPTKLEIKEEYYE